MSVTSGCTFAISAFASWISQSGTSSRRRVLLPQGIWLDRATWTQPADVYQRLLLVESYECRTRGEAQDLLVGLLAQFQVPPDLAAVADAGVATPS